MTVNLSGVTLDNDYSGTFSDNSEEFTMIPEPIWFTRMMAMPLIRQAEIQPGNSR